ncbi:MAG: hypothetical protein BWX54_02407 [Verrucomicrobia bacterium ADurb.Bin018]|nr:MAG: hypothetical protein BWX54_02407 [Verrucomicrobia bacterium ADurb.Bin018]
MPSGQQHDQAVRADGQAAVRRRAVFQRPNQVAKAALNFRLGQAQKLEHPRLELRVVNPDAAPAQLRAIEHDVVGLRADLFGVRVEQRNVFGHGRSERMVDADQPAFLIALEQRKVRHPRELEDVVGNDLGPRRRQQANPAQHRQHFGRGIRTEQNQVAGLDLQQQLQAGFLGFSEELDDGRFPSAVFLHANIGQAAKAALLGQARPVFLHELDRRVGQPLGVDGLDHAAAFQRAAKHLELGALEDVGQIHNFHAEAQVGLVTAEAVHGLAVGHARQGQFGHGQFGGGHQSRQQAIHSGDDVIRGDERHFEVNLREFRLAVGAQIFVAETPRNLHIAIHAGHHQQLLVLLWGLRQREE